MINFYKRTKFACIMQIALCVLFIAGCDLFTNPKSEPERQQSSSESHDKHNINPADSSSAPILLPKNVVIVSNVTHIEQKPDFCGEACVAMYLRSLGYKITQDDVFNMSKTSPNLGRGCYAPDLYRALKAIGFKLEPTDEIWHWLKDLNDTQAKQKMESRFNKIVKNMRAGYPSICCMHWYESPKSPEHFRLLIGYDPESETVYYLEPASENKAIHQMSKSDFFKIWPIGQAGNKCLVTFTLKPGNIKIPRQPKPKFKTLKYKYGETFHDKKIKIREFTNADYAQHIMKLKKKPAGKNMTYIVCKPFVVAGNMSNYHLQQNVKNVVKWAAQKYRKQYFNYNPDDILTIYLMRNKTTYEQACRNLMNFTPETPYGFFSSSNKLLMMNIATGGGTLVHEMFHAYVPANFPAMPAWCNEGFASLYEQCNTRNGKIIGLVNWRLPGLQTAIKNKRTIPLKELISTTTDEFYGPNSGLNYAMARYLCYYLQQKGKLNKFYKTFAANQEKDPTGLNSLLKVLEIREDQLPAFQKKWEAWCAKLRFGR